MHAQESGEIRGHDRDQKYSSLPSAPTLVTRSSTAENQKQNGKHVRFNMDIEIRKIQGRYNGERYVGNLRWKTMHATKSSTQDWLAGDGAATKHCLRRPSYKLIHVERSERTPREQQEWEKIQEDCAKEARIRAVQMHFQIISRLANALPVADPRSTGPQARRVNTSVLLPALYDADEYGRSWIYDTGAAKSAIGRNHLTASEQKRIQHCLEQRFMTAAGVLRICHVVSCYVP